MKIRWTEKELHDVEIYLKSLTTWTLADHLLSVEHVVERYHPHDGTLTQENWERFLKAKRIIMIKNLYRKKSPEVAEFLWPTKPVSTVIDDPEFQKVMDEFLSNT